MENLKELKCIFCDEYLGKAEIMHGKKIHAICGKCYESLERSEKRLMEKVNELAGKIRESRGKIGQ